MAEMNPKAMYKISYGLFVCTAAKDGRMNGCIINTAMQVASEPNRISIAVNKANLTHDMIRETGVCNISVISRDADFSLFKHFGFRSGREVDKFGADYPTSSPLVAITSSVWNAIISSSAGSYNSFFILIASLYDLGVKYSFAAS